MKQEIAEVNRILAEFMGYRLIKTVYGELYSNIPEPLVYEGHEIYLEEIKYPSTLGRIDQLQCHKSFDWLLEVWKKCMEIGLWMSTNGYDKLWFEKSKEIENAIIREFDCEKASILISQLINWYNLNKH